ncbi:uncharacterized protein FRV6_06713 [Fusarium oxysporum]|uniref:Protein kinase domain-containing protein n=1 Tax=Fusarium oxysporum TaxID=5507 RepID=A0A2H3THF4_FUSOX|nr:uncharacterized protein FRV6_06713 [Fusarium oxysporum]
MNRAPTTDSLPGGSTQSAPLIEESIFESEDSEDWSDFVDSDEEPDVEFAREDINLYPKGFYYPTSISDIIVGRYCIIHKLGHGVFSTVWVAQDMTEDRDVALKILMLGSPDDHDCQMQSEIISIAKDSTKAPIATRMLLAVQLLKALKALHEAEIVHADLNTANIMCTLRPLNNIISEKYKQIGRPRKMKLWTEQWKDGELVMPMKPKEELIGDSIVLRDFGLAHKAGTSTQKMQSPATYCAPERVHNINPSYGSDIWSYICIPPEPYTGTYPFQGWSHASVVSSIVHAFGPLPESWKGTYHVGGSGEDKWYDQNWQMDPESDLKERITQLRPDVGARELELVLSILRRGLVYQHENRITAAELLNHDSFKGLMCMYAQ